jgi:6-phosphogluconolactonase
MKRPAKSYKAFPAAGFLVLLVLGFAGQAFADKKPKFVYVANSGGDGAEFYETFHFTATAVCTSVSCASPISISGTFTLDLTIGDPVNGSMSLSDPADLKSSPLVLPLYDVESNPYNVLLLFGEPSYISGNPNNVLLVFPVTPRGLFFPVGYSGGTLCSTPLTSGCGTPSVVQFASSGGTATAAITSGSVTLTGTSGTLQGPGGVSGYAIDSTTGALTPVPGSPFAAGLDPNSVAVDPSNRFVYVANYASNNVSAFMVNSSTGALTPVPGSPFVAGLEPDSVAVDPSDRFVYLANQGSNNVSAYTLNKTTGALTAVSGSPFPAGTGPTFMTMDPKGRFIYVTNGTIENYGSISEYAIDTATGALNQVNGSPLVNGVRRSFEDPVAAVVDPSGKFLYDIFEYESGSPALAYTIDSTTGALTQFASPGMPTDPLTAAIDPSGRFFYVASREEMIFGLSLDSATGALGTFGTPNLRLLAITDFEPDSMAIDPSGRFAYLVNEGSNDISGYAIDGDTGALTPIPGSPFATGRGPSSLAIAGSSSTPFEAFKAKVAIDQDRRTSFRVAGFFRLGQTSDGIDPVNEAVQLQVGTFSTTIPAGSFKKEGKREFEFEGWINDVELRITIHHVEERRGEGRGHEADHDKQKHEDTKDFLFTAQGRGHILAGVVNPVTVGLTIGDDEGSTTVKADIDR